MTTLDEKIVISRWLELKGSAEHYERLRANAEKSTHSEAPYWAMQWNSFAKEKRRQMDVMLEALPEREDLLKRVV